MTTKTFLTLLLSAIFLFLFVSSSNAFLNRDVKKAKEFMAAGMYPQAIELLNKRINEKPTDAEAHFLLGKIFLEQREFSSANKRFKSVMALESRQSQDISELYTESANRVLNQGNIKLGDQLIQEAINFNPKTNRIQFNEKYRYLCVDEFMMGDNGGEVELKPYIDTANELKYKKNSEINGDLRFKGLQNSVVYIWKLKR